MAGERPAGDGRIIDAAAFEAAFREHFPPVYRFIARRVGPALAGLAHLSLQVPPGFRDVHPPA